MCCYIRRLAYVYRLKPVKSTDSYNIVQLFNVYMMPISIYDSARAQASRAAYTALA